MRRKHREEHVAREFDRAARGYDDSRLVRSFQRRTQAMVVDSLTIERGMHILDLGCGTGWATLEIASRLQGTGRVIGLDLSPKMIEQAEGKLGASGCGNVEFVLGSAGSLEYDGLFDHVVSTNAFHHFVDREEVFSRVRRSLKPGGSFVLQDFCADFWPMRIVDICGKIGERAHVGTTTSGGLRALFSAAGFVEIQVQTMKLNWFWGIMIGRGLKGDREQP
jgi:ubiquinone/menaquinone biosynthesis C-methylase UbiE